MDQLLEPVGLGPAESAVYLTLIDRPHRTVGELAAATGIAAGRLRRSMKQLMDAGLVTRLPGSPPRYTPAPPDLAVDALAVRRQQQLEQLRTTARRLARQLADAPHGSPGDLIKIVEGRQAVQQQVAMIQLAAESEVCIIDCPPYLTGHPTENPQEMQGLARGVRYRAIYHEPTIAKLGRTADILRYVDAGEHARALPDVHMKMTLADRRIAIIPLSSAQTETGVRILVHSSPLLTALITCFELLWERAIPLAADAGPGNLSSDVRPDGGLSDIDRRILTMLAAGMKDRAMARSLGIAERTVSRRLTDLMRTLGATTRFQAALQATRRGWL